MKLSLKVTFIQSFLLAEVLLAVVPIPPSTGFNNPFEIAFLKDTSGFGQCPSALEMPPWTLTASAAVLSMSNARRIKYIYVLASLSCFHLVHVPPFRLEEDNYYLIKFY